MTDAARPVPPRAPFDRWSLAGLICAGTCCLAPIGAGLGIAGLRRTRGGRRRGRWAAVTAIVLGCLGTVAVLGGFALLIWYDARYVTPAQATVGQCVDLERRANSAAISLRERSCDAAHDAEIVHAGTFDDELVAAYLAGTPHDLCLALLDDAVRSRVDPERFHLGVAVAGRTGDPRPGDDFACYADGRTEQLTEPLAPVS
jgi:hypothetical protein